MKLVNRLTLISVLLAIVFLTVFLNSKNEIKEIQMESENLDHLGIEMKFWDSRPESCKSKIYTIKKSESVSFIIAHFNEPLLTLLKLIISIFKQTNNDHLKEIIIIDDFSDESYNFNMYFERHKISEKLLYRRNSKREGLIRSRNIGANLSSGKYLIFLDSHSEVGVNFLEPLLARIKYHPYAVLSPILDTLSARKYKVSSSVLKGGFDWNLRYKWVPMSEEEREKRTDPTQPFVSPTTLGGTFLVRKKWFIDLGGFDDHMQIWGGESTEFSIKNWLCGGHIEIVPCSRVGHKFQEKHLFNYSTNTFDFNSKRIVEAWFGDFKHIYYSNRPEAREIPTEKMEEKEKIKKRLNCRDFKWYLSNIFPTLLENQEYVAFGSLKQGNKCLILSNQNKLELKSCRENFNESNVWTLKKETEHLILNDKECVAADKGGLVDLLHLEKCSDARNQRWTRRGAKLYHRESHECLEHIRENSLQLSPCQPIISQFWHFSFELQTPGF